MPFTLFCLGTDVAYTPGDYLANAVGPDIKLRETLSAIAGYIAAPAIARAPVAIDTAKADFNDIHYLSAVVVVLDGADTIGAKVHDKIAKGLMVILDALMQGERSINIVGFSRGAVQSLHITHELQRIKDACKNTALESLDKAMLINIICTAGTAWSTNHLNNYHKPFLNEHLTDEHVAALASALLDEADETKIRLNLFALDPVPGLCEGDRAALSPIRALEFWGASAKRHYHVPEIVSRYSTILHEDECSWAFNLAVPKQNSAKTAMQYMSLPGFHGTGNGSPMLHDPARINNPGDDYTKRRGVQTLVFYKILTFLVEVGVQLRPAPEAAEYHLDNEYRDFLEQNTPMARALLFERHYDEVLENKSFYRKLRQDWYTGLGRDPVESSTYQRKVMGHVNTQHPRPLSDYVNFNIEKEQPYVNAEHYQLKMTAALRTLSVLNAVEWSEQELYQLPLVEVAIRVNVFMEKLSNPGFLKTLTDLLIHRENDTNQAIHNRLLSIPQSLANGYLDQTQPTQPAVLYAIKNILDVKKTHDESIDALLAEFKNGLVSTMQHEIKTHWDNAEAFIRGIGQRNVDENSSDEEDALVVQNQPSHRALLQQANNHYLQLKHLITTLSELSRDQLETINSAKTLSCLRQAELTFPIRLESTLNECGIVIQRDEWQDMPLGEKIIPYMDIRLGQNAPQVLELKTEKTRTQAAHGILTDLEVSSQHPVLNGLTMEILGGFAAVIGIAAVSVAMTALIIGSAGLVAPILLGIVGVALASSGLFAVRAGSNMERDESIALKLRQALA